MTEQSRCQPQGKEIQNPEGKPDGRREIDEEDRGDQTKRRGGGKIWPNLSE
jgi:hypothetical protein